MVESSKATKFPALSILYGADGNDALTGNNLANVIHGGFGNDLIFGEGGRDVMRGEGDDDTLSGGSGNDILWGGDGNDTVLGGIGNDEILADRGADILDGGDGIDTLSFRLAGGATVSLATGIGTGLDAAGDKFANFENLHGAIFAACVFTGDDQANRLTGGEENDELHGGGGNDTLVGGNDRDTLEGGDGADRFLYRYTSDGGDSITDFTSGSDKMQISKSGYSIYVAGSTLPVSYFVTGLAATVTGHGQFIYDAAADQLFWDQDGIGGAAARLIATFTNNPTLQASDIQLIA